MTKVEMKDLAGYDKVPYPSYPFEYTRPENLKSVAMLFGVNPADFENARVLELGCSDGSNLLSFAQTFPKSYTLGVDLSPVQIRNGQDRLDKFNIKNVELKAMSITDLDESYGEFDYIICQGVFSWVPDFVQKSILEICQKLLTHTGVAFISYNTLPGWNMIKSTRDLMLYHAEGFSDVNEQIIQARAVFSFIQESLKDIKTPYAQYMQLLATELSDKENSYIKHEYLEPNNCALYFKDFIKQVRENGLDYIGDTDIYKMYINNLPKTAIDKLGTVKDLVRFEQYVDFIYNTQFRCSLITRQGKFISRNINSDTIEKFHYYADVKPDSDDKTINIKGTNSEQFYIGGKDRSVSASLPEVKAILYTLYKNPGNPLSVDELVDKASAFGLDKQSIRQNILSNFAHMMFSSVLKYVVSKPHNIYEISDKPRISTLAINQLKEVRANGKVWVSNAINQPIFLAVHQVGVVKFCDGNHTVKQIKMQVLEDLQSGKMTASDANSGVAVTDKKQLKTIADRLVDDVLETLRINYLLVV